LPGLPGGVNLKFGKVDFHTGMTNFPTAAFKGRWGWEGPARLTRISASLHRSAGNAACGALGGVKQPERTCMLRPKCSWPRAYLKEEPRKVSSCLAAQPDHGVNIYPYRNIVKYYFLSRPRMNVLKNLLFGAAFRYSGIGFNEKEQQ